MLQFPVALHDDVVAGGCLQCQRTFPAHLCNHDVAGGQTPNFSRPSRVPGQGDWHVPSLARTAELDRIVLAKGR